MYKRDLSILYNKVVTYYRSLILIGHKDLLEESEITILEGIYTQLNKTNFVFNKEGKLVEKESGLIDKLKENLRKSGEVDKVLNLIKNSRGN